MILAIPLEDLFMLAKLCLSSICTSHNGPLASIYGEYLTKVDEYKYMFWLATFNLLITTSLITNRLAFKSWQQFASKVKLSSKVFHITLWKPYDNIWYA